MADTATGELKNKVQITDAGPSRKRISIEIPAERVTEKLSESLQVLSTQAELPGFRRGHVPTSLLQRRFGPAMRSEAKNQLVAAAYSEAVEEHKLKVIGDPAAEGLAKVELQDGKPLVFDLEVEVQPEFELPNLEGIQVKRPMLEVTDDMVEKEIEKLRINEGRLESREKPEPGDYLTGKGRMVGADGTEFYNIDGAVVQVPPADRGGKGMILGVLVEDFAEQLGAPGAGDEVTIRTRGPENHEVEGIRNADLTITFKVDRVDRIIPASMDELVQAFGFEGEAALRDAVQRRIQQRIQVQQQAAMRQQAGKYLLDNTSVALPERMTAQQAARTFERRRMELMYRGVEPQQIEEHLAELRAGSGQAAERELKLFFIITRAAEVLNVQVSEAEINGRIAQLAFERNMRPEKLRQEIVQNNRVGAIFQQVRDHKTIDAILARAQITDVPADEYSKWAKAELGAG